MNQPIKSYYNIYSRLFLTWLLYGFLCVNICSPISIKGKTTVVARDISNRYIDDAPNVDIKGEDNKKIDHEIPFVTGILYVKEGTLLSGVSQDNKIIIKDKRKIKTRISYFSKSNNTNKVVVLHKKIESKSRIKENNNHNALSNAGGYFNLSWCYLNGHDYFKFFLPASRIIWHESFDIVSKNKSGKNYTEDRLLIFLETNKIRPPPY